MTLELMLRDQERDYATVDNAVAAMEAKIAGLDKQLREEVLRARTAEIRSGALKALSALVAVMNARAKDASESARLHTPEAELRFARFHAEESTNAAMTLATFARLARTSAAELIEHLKDAVGARKLALVDAIRLEFSSRPEPERRDLKEAFAAEFGKLEFARSRGALAAVGRIKSMAALGQERFAAATTGRSDPVARMTAARMAAA